MGSPSRSLPSVTTHWRRSSPTRHAPEARLAGPPCASQRRRGGHEHHHAGCRRLQHRGLALDHQKEALSAAPARPTQARSCAFQSSGALTELRQRTKSRTLRIYLQGCIEIGQSLCCLDSLAREAAFLFRAERVSRRSFRPLAKFSISAAASATAFAFRKCPAIQPFMYC